MHFYKIFAASSLRILAVLLIVAVLLPAPAFSLDSEDSQLFISGFNAYQRKEYNTAIADISGLLKKYPDTSLRDMALFWLARSHYKAGNQQEAAKHMAQFLREYPQSPLKGTVEEELVVLAESYSKGETLKPSRQPAAKAPVAAEKGAPKAAETAAAKAAADRVAAERVAAEKAAAEKAAAEKAAAEKAAAEKAAAAKAVADRATEKAAADKVAAEKTAADKAAADKVAADKTAADKAAVAQIAAERAAADKAAAEQVAADRAAAAKAAADKAAAAKAKKREKAAQKMLAAARKKESPAKAAKSEKARNRAIAAYQAVVNEFPGTAAAASAAANLQQLKARATAQPKPALPSAASAPQQPTVAQVFNLEVAQYADVEVTLGAAPETQEAGKPFSIPFDLVNTGNGSDSFYLESGFPAEFGFRFAALSSPEIPINRTPELAVGEKFRGVAVGTMPRGNMDGQKNQYPIKVVSAFGREVSQSREIVLVTSAPLLRAVVKSEKTKLLPGEKNSYRVSLLNVGTAPARGVTLRVNYPPQYEPIDFRSLGFAQEAKAALVLDSLLLKSGEGKDFNLTFQLKDEALAEQELFLRVDVVNNDLEKKESFVSATSTVQRVSGISARTAAEKLVVVPGQVVSIPVTVTNTGNIREVFAIKAKVAGNASYTFFDDLNRDGKRQTGEPIINHVGPLSPKEEAYVLLELETPASANDGTVAPVSVFFEPETAADRSAAVNVQLAYSRPILELSMAAQGGRLKPGEVSSLELNCVNRGSNLAKQVVLQSILPDQLELVAADPSFTKADNGIYLWRFEELGAGEKRNIRVTYRVKPGIAVGTSMQLKNLVNYQDPLGNRY